MSAAVSYVTVRLADGTALTLHPVSVYGTRFVGYVVPRRVKVARITAYSARGTGLDDPLQRPDGTLATGLWLRPGQTGMRRAAHLIGSGMADGHAWSAAAYVGPWGECLVWTALGPLAVLQRGPARDRLGPHHRGVRGRYEQPG